MFLLSNDYWEIKDTEKKGRGVFAKKDIAGGIVIGDYIGKVIPVADDDKYDKKGHFYLMYYTDDFSIYPDPKKAGIHILNNSCSPNCFMYTYKAHTLYFSLRHIFAGEELTISYLLEPQDKDCKPCVHLCHCGSIVCTQSMHQTEKRYDQWSTFDEKITDLTTPTAVTVGQELSMLSSYPKTIADHDIYPLFGNTEKEPIKKDDKILPQVAEIRKTIRETGRTVLYPTCKLHVFGFQNNLLIGERVSTTS